MHLIDEQTYTFNVRPMYFGERSLYVADNQGAEVTSGVEYV
jgi:hypothetical protein